MSSPFLRSWTFETPTGSMIVAESKNPDEVLLAVSGTASLTQEQFRALAELASYSSYSDYVRFAEPESQP